MFIHRIGRVARNGKYGCALSIVEHCELPHIADIYKFLGHEINKNLIFDADNKHNYIIQTEQEQEQENEDEDEDDDEDDDKRMIEIDSNGMMRIEQNEDDEELFEGMMTLSKSSKSSNSLNSSLILNEK
eukprot:293043_1